MIKFIILLFLTSFLISCTTLEKNRNFERNTHSNLFDALDKEKNNFSSNLLDNKKFTIVSTYKNSNKLCRLVKFESDKSFYAETFCKIKGGEWK